MKKIKHFLTVFDGFWSVPLMIAIFLGLGFLGASFFGPTVGWYDPAIWQTGFTVVGMWFLLNFAVWVGLRLNFRGIFRYFTGKKLGEDHKGEDVFFNKSVEDGSSLSPWQRTKLCFAVYFLQLFTLVAILRILIS